MLFTRWVVDIISWGNVEIRIAEQSREEVGCRFDGKHEESVWKCYGKDYIHFSFGGRFYIISFLTNNLFFYDYDTRIFLSSPLRVSFIKSDSVLGENMKICILVYMCISEWEAERKAVRETIYELNMTFK